MFKEFLMKKMLKSQGVTDDQIEMVTTLMNKDPELFKKIADETQAKVNGGMNQQQAAMEVMIAHQAELQELMK